MTQPKTLIIQVACGFEVEPRHGEHHTALSHIDEQRAKELIEIATNPPFDEEFIIATTGRVPYDALTAPKRTLANINQARLEAHDKTVAHQIDGFNAFSESWNAIRLAKKHGYKEIYLVTSDFYLHAYLRMWHAAAKRAGIQLTFVELESDRERCANAWKFYESLQPQLLSKVAASSRIGHWLVMQLADWKTKSRATQGFQMNGYSEIG